MPYKKPAQRLHDILDQIDAIRDFTAGMDNEAFAGNHKTVQAVGRALQAIWNESSRLPEEFKTRYPGAGLPASPEDGNAVWNTVARHIDPLESAARAEIERLASLGA
jgi:uncharacterized protein with HEPN domain